MTKSVLFLITFLLATDAIAQSSLVSGRRVSRPERWWALKHMFVAHKARCLTKIALAETYAVANAELLDNDSRGGQLDAFRHSYWMALLAQQIKPWKVMKLGIAHEKGNFIDFRKGRMEEGILPDKMSSAMDLYNNQIGVNTGYGNNETDMESLKWIIIKQIKEGKMVVISKDKNGNYLHCDGTVIDLTAYENQWDIPKCLEASSVRN